jgi:hypothetical protein
MTELTITDTHKIQALQTEFSNHFPFLKIEFYSEAHEAGQGNSNAKMLDANHSIGEVRKVHNTGHVSMHGNLKVSTLESSFKEVYGLNVQVFRKSGVVYLQTTASDHWTLSEQNETAKEHSEANH